LAAGAVAANKGTVAPHATHRVKRGRVMEYMKQVAFIRLITKGTILP
jgi:hypothetical protein